ncbi:MAG: divalent-cation tolerance protein CutA [Holosporaceae bacterium]|jgi:periplasmic divalent cation tolerance protein|nr:divalent-cation tolerance protein CutA [Holosporaceae bacterium]
MKNSKYSIVLSTLESEKEAEILAKKILEKKLAFCIQIQKVKSLYPWNSKIECVSEYLLMIKTRQDLFQEISEYIKLNHSYKIPEIIQVPITDGSKEYLDWGNDIVS